MSYLSKVLIKNELDRLILSSEVASRKLTVKIQGWYRPQPDVFFITFNDELSFTPQYTISYKFVVMNKISIKAPMSLKVIIQ